MQVKVDKTEPSPVRRELRVEVAAEDVASQLERVLNGFARGVRIPGFRQGKVPKNLIRKRFAREIERELLEKLVPEALGRAFESTGDLPLHEPVIKDVELEDGKPLRFTAAFEVKPRLQPTEYRGVVLEAVERKVTDADLDAELTAMRERAAHYEPIEARPARRGDFVVVDIRSEVEGVERVQDGALIEVGGEEYHPEFARNLEGMAPGESRTFYVTYGEDDPDPRARGKRVKYTAQVKELKAKVVPLLDDEFAKEVSEHASLAELRDAVRGDLGRRLEQLVRRAQERQLADALLAPFASTEVPNALVEVELDRGVEEQIRALMGRGIDPRTAPIDWRQTRTRLRPQAERHVKWELLLEAIADLERVEVTDGAVEGRLERIAEEAEKSVEFVRSKIEKDGRMEELRRTLRLEKTVDFLLANARMERR